MERQTIKTKKSNQGDSQIKMVTRWNNTEEPSPAFRQLMRILLKPREDRPVKRKVSNNFQRKTETETDPETYTETDTER